MSLEHTSERSGVSLGRVLKWGGIAIILLPFIIILFARGHVASDINRLRQKSIDRGEPQTIEELVEPYSTIKPEDNVAEGLLDIWEKEEGNYWTGWRNTGGIQGAKNRAPIDPDVPFVGETMHTAIPWPDTEIAAARAFVESRQERNTKIREALARPKSQFPIDMTKGFSTLLPHLSMFKSEVNALQVENYLAIQEGRTDDSIDSLNRMAQLNLALKEEPYLISQLVRIACKFITFRGAEELISRRQLDVNQIDQIAAIIDTLKMSDGYYRAMLAERAGVVEVFAMQSNQLNALNGTTPGAGNGTPEQILWALMKFSGYLSLDQRLTMDTYDKILILSTNLNGDSYSQISTVMDETMKEARSFPPKPLTGMLFPALSKASEKFLRAEAERRLLMAALAIERYRVEHDGALPETLDQATSITSPEDLIDPFDEQPIRFMPSIDGYTLYSVGSDLTDNQGQSNGAQSDVVLSITHRATSGE